MAVQTVAVPHVSLSTYDDVNEVRDKASEVLEYPDVWMVTPNERLGFKRPDEVVTQYGENGKKLVLSVIEAIREGVFS